MSIFRIIKKFRLILSSRQKLRIVELAIIMIIAAFLEMLSVSLILPFMNAVLDQDAIMENKYVAIICEILNIRSHRTFLVFLALVMAVIYIVKNVFLLFQMLVQNKFVNNNRFQTQRLLLRSYLLRPYEFFLDVKSGDVLQIINNDTINVFGMMSNLLMLLSELVVSAVLIITILVISPGITVGVAILMFIMIAIIQAVIRPILRRIGEESRIANAGAQQWLIQAIQGIKELKIMRSEKFFEKNYNENGKRATRTAYISSTLSIVPRFMIEAVSMASFFIVIAFMIYRGVRLETLIPILSGVAMAAIRLLPSVNRITNSLAMIAYSEPALDKMGERLAEVISAKDEIMNEEDISQKPKGIIGDFHSSIGMNNVSYRYPKGDVDVLRDATIEIKSGQSIGIVGASGAGKTTAVDIILGLLSPTAGSITVDGTDIKEDMGGWLSQIGYIPQSIFMLDGDVRTNVAFGEDANGIDDSKVWEALREASIDDFIKSLPDSLNTEIGERGVRLSGGQRQRIGIARALYRNPSILFLDEATSALDNDTEASIMEAVNSLHGSKTMIIIAHRLSTIEGCDHVFRVDGGKIVQER